MHEPPPDLDPSTLRAALHAWSIDVRTLDHLPVGFGDHHWRAVDAKGARWFVTVAELATKDPGGDTAAGLDRLRTAMDAAATLHERCGLTFVAAPRRAPGGATVLPLGARYGVSVFAERDGAPGRFDDPYTPRDRDAVLAVLARLHATPAPAGVPHLPLVPATRPRLEDALAALDRPWNAGPLSPDAHAALARHADAVRRRLADLERLAGTLRDAAPVLTHGEPHRGNVLVAEAEPVLVDWDTVAVALPERDLWGVAGEGGPFDAYVAAGGRRPDPAALALYALRWDLDEVAVYVDQLRRPHARTADAEEACAGLVASLRRTA